MSKRLISMLLVVVLVITLLPMSVFAASNAKTIKESEINSTSVESSEPEGIGNPNGEYTVTIKNDSVSSTSDFLGKTKYLVKYAGQEQVITLDAGESKSFKINDGDEYSVIYQGTSTRFNSSFKGMTMVSGNVETNSNKENWTHTLGQGFTNTIYYSAEDPDTIIESADREIDENGNVIKSNTRKTYTIAESGYVWGKGYTCTITNEEDPSEYYSSTKGAFSGGADGAKTAAKNALNAQFAKTFSSYSAYEKDSKYYIAEKLASKTETIECPANDVVLTFKSEITPITGNMSVNVYGPGTTRMAEENQFKNVDFSLLGKALGWDLWNIPDRLSDATKTIYNQLIGAVTSSLGNITEPTPKVVLKLVEKEGQDDYQGHVYYLSEDNTDSLGTQLLDWLPENVKGLLSSDLDATFISRKYILPNDILKGEYTLIVESIDEDGVSLSEESSREMAVTIDEGIAIVGTQKSLLLSDDWASTVSKISEYSKDVPLLGEIISFIANFSVFKGVFLKDSGSFSFKKVDVADKALPNAEFYMVNRDEVEKIINYCFGLGKDTFVRVIKNMGDETVFDWEEVVTLHTQLLKQDEENNLSLNTEAITKLIGTYVALLTTVDGKATDLTDPESLATNIPKLINFEQLRQLKIPAILKSTSDDKGIVEWSKASNVTTTLFTNIVKQIVPRLTEALAQLTANGVESPISLVEGSDEDVEEAEASGFDQADMIKTILDLVMNDGLSQGLVYNILWRLGIVTEKLPAGHYILFESKAPAGHLRNPMFYTVNVEWKDDDWVYASVADAGLLLPRIAENYYTYLRNINLTEAADKLIYNMLKPFVYNEEDLAKCQTIYSDIVTNKTDASAAMIKFVSEELWYAYGEDLPYESEAALQEEMIKYLYNQGRTVQNLMVFAHDIARRNKGVITGEMNEDWHLYNLEASIFKTWQKSTKAIMDRLSDSIAVGDIELPNEDETVSKFKDLNPARWYYTAVKWVLNNGIMAGVTTTDFRTATPVTRGMAVTVLYAAADYPEYTNNSPFSDVSKLRYYYNAVGWAYENGIVEGIGDNKFAPEKTLTRQELVTMLKKFCEVMDMDINDVDTGAQIGLDQKVDFGSISGWAKTAMEWAFKVGAIFGLTEDTIDPLDVVTRAQLAQIIYKIMTYEKPAATPATDVPTGDIPAENTSAENAA